MKTVYFKLANPPSGVSLWEVAFTRNPGDPSMSNWGFTGFQTLEKTIKAIMPDDADWVAFYAGVAGQQASYAVAYQGQTIFVTGATYVWDAANETLTRESAEVPPPPVPDGGFLETLKKNIVPIGIGAALLGIYLTREK